ncbi:MAG: glycosyltransferase family 2 protein [Pseudomonadota bacterium]
MKKSALPQVAVVILNFNGKDHLPGCLQALAGQDYPALSVSVVDNRSDDGSAEWVVTHAPGVKLIRHVRNLGWSGGNNRGIRHALEQDAQYIWLLNSDVDIASDCVRQLVSFMDAHPAIGLCGPMIYGYARRDELSPFGGAVDFKRMEIRNAASVDEFRRLPFDGRFISGCALFARRAVFDRIGLLDERFFLFFEDADFSLRAARAGFSMDIVETAMIYHKEGASMGGVGNVNPLKVYHGLRSGMLFWKKHLSRWSFHRKYCAGHMGKWLQQLGGSSDAGVQEAIMDALWYVFSGRRSTLEWPASPPWFRRLLLWKPWLFGELMSWRPGGILKR